MPTTDSSAAITQAILALQDALRNESTDKKKVKADTLKAVNLLLGTLGLPSVKADDPDDILKNQSSGNITPPPGN